MALVQPLLFDNKFSVYKTLCKILQKQSPATNVMTALEIPVYERWISDHVECIADIAKNNIECVLVIPSNVKCKTLLASLRHHMVDLSLCPKLTMLFHFSENQKVSGIILNTGVNVWHVRFNSNEPRVHPDNIVSESQLNVSEANAVSSSNPMEFGGLADIPEGIVSEGLGAFRCTAFHEGKPIRVLLDTGACASFVGPVLVESLKLHTSPGKLNIHSAGGQSIKALRFVPEFSVVFNFGEYFAKLWVVQIPHNIDIILGCDWLHANGVMIDMAERIAHFKTRVGKIISEIHGHVSDSLKEPSLQLAPQRMLNPEPNISTISESRKVLRNHPQSLTPVKDWPNINTVNKLQLLAAVDLYGRETDYVIVLTHHEE